MGAPNREPQEYSRNIIEYIEYEDPGRYVPIISSYSYYILGLPCLGFAVKSLYLNPDAWTPEF